MLLRQRGQIHRPSDYKGVSDPSILTYREMSDPSILSYEDKVEKVALILYNKYLTDCKMKPVDNIGANQTRQCNLCREDARVLLKHLIIVF